MLSIEVLQLLLSTAINRPFHSLTHSGRSSATIYSMYGLDYEPRNAKEKWLLRIVYWGTILLVAFFFWEYVKAK